MNGWEELQAASGFAQAAFQQNKNRTRQHTPSRIQRMPVMRPDTDSAAGKMPVVKPDTAIQENMPVVKPPAKIQPK